MVWQTELMNGAQMSALRLALQIREILILRLA